MTRYLPTLLGLILLLAGCTSSDRYADEFDAWLQNNGKKKVVSTTAIIHDLVAQVAGEEVDCIPLIVGQLDPHSYELVKGDGEKLECADLIFSNGLGLEHGASLQNYLANSRRTVALGDRIVVTSPGALIEVDGQPDPHIWMDVLLWSRAVGVVVEALSLIDPQHTDLFRQRGIAVTNELFRLNEVVATTIAEIRPEDRFLVTTHDAFNYFARRYMATPDETKSEAWRMRCQSPEGIAPDGQVGALDIDEIVSHLIRHKIALLFPESNQNLDSLRKIVQVSRELGHEVSIGSEPVFGDVLGEEGSGAETYLGMLRYNARVIADGLSIREGQDG